MLIFDQSKLEIAESFFTVEQEINISIHKNDQRYYACKNIAGNFLFDPVVI